MSAYAQALECWRGCNARQAEAICRAMLENGTDRVAAMRLLADIYDSTGRPTEAIACLESLLPLLPGDAGLRRQLGNLQLARETPLDAMRSYREALRVDPGDPGQIRTYNNLGQALLRLGNLSEAAESFRRAIALDPRYAIAHNNLGIVLERCGLLEQALESYQCAAALEPTLADAHCNRGRALARMTRPAEALDCYDQALRYRPQLLEALLGRANTLQKLYRFDAALSDYERILSHVPEHGAALCSAASALLALNRPAEALQLSDRALQRQPCLAEAHLNRAGALREMDRREEALIACDRALSLQPAYLDALCNRGRLLREMGDHEAAIDSFRHALCIDPQHAEARSRLVMAQIPAVAASDAQLQAARTALEAELDALMRWLATQREVDELAIVGGSQLFFLAYQESCNRDILVRHGRACCELMWHWHQRQDIGQAAPAPRPATDLPTRIRVGIASAYIREHSVYRALVQGWLRQLDAARLDVSVFHLDTTADAETAAARARVTLYVEGVRPLAEWVEVIRSANLDMLIYPEIGMHPLTMRLACLRLAPRQAVAWGHPDTSGLPTMDYYLSAEGFEAPGSHANYSEQLVRLAHLGCYYEPSDCPDRPFDSAALGLSADRPLLVCPGAPFKYAPAHDPVWVEIARRLGHCQLLYFEPRDTSLSSRLRARLTAAFHAAGLRAADYLLFLPWQPAPQFHALLRRADVFLDTIGFSGFNTAMQAAECQLPLVTYEGRFMRGRFGSAIAERMGLPELVTRSCAGYVDLAVRLARDASYRQDIRERIRASSASLFRDRSAIDSLERFITDAVGAQ